MAEAVSAGVECVKWSRPFKQAINFFRADEQPKPAKITSTGILTSARDSCLWTLEQKAIHSTTDAAEGASRWLLLKESHGVIGIHLDTSWGLINPDQLGHLEEVYDVERPE